MGVDDSAALVRHVIKLRSTVLWSAIVTNLLIFALVAVIAIVASHVVDVVSGELKEALVSLRKATSAMTSFFQNNPDAAAHIETQLSASDHHQHHNPPPAVTAPPIAPTSGGF